MCKIDADLACLTHTVRCSTRGNIARRSFQFRQFQYVSMFADVYRFFLPKNDWLAVAWCHEWRNTRRCDQEQQAQMAGCRKLCQFRELWGRCVLTYRQVASGCCLAGYRRWKNWEHSLDYTWLPLALDLFRPVLYLTTLRHSRPYEILRSESVRVAERQLKSCCPLIPGLVFRSPQKETFRRHESPVDQGRVFKWHTCHTRDPLLWEGTKCKLHFLRWVRSP